MAQTKIRECKKSTKYKYFLFFYWDIVINNNNNNISSWHFDITLFKKNCIHEFKNTPSTIIKNHELRTEVLSQYVQPRHRSKLLIPDECTYRQV